jgi:hypothetical protein
MDRANSAALAWTQGGHIRGYITSWGSCPQPRPNPGLVPSAALDARLWSVRLRGRTLHCRCRAIIDCYPLLPGYDLTGCGYARLVLATFHRLLPAIIGWPDPADGSAYHRPATTTIRLLPGYRRLLPGYHRLLPGYDRLPPTNIGCLRLTSAASD